MKMKRSKVYEIKATGKNVVEMLIGRGVLFLIQCILIALAIVGFFWGVGMIQMLIEKIPVLWIPLIAVVVVAMRKLIQESK